MNFRFTDRIALYNTAAAAVATTLVFLAVYAVVFQTSFNHLDSDISLEADEVLNTLRCEGDTIFIDRISEWEEQEHKQTEVNPTFMQIVSRKGRLIFHSANLLGDHLLFDTTFHQRYYFNSSMAGQQVRVGQFPVRNDVGRITGFLSIGISRQESTVVLKNLRATLLLVFPFLLIVLYVATSFAASRSIHPVNRIISELGGINDTTIHRRLPLPIHKDEIHQLTTTINELLRRIESGLLREKQFTSDASHELRTPLAAIRGTLEVLVRKPRETHQYEEKVRQVIREVDRMHQIVDKLLQLARLESPDVVVRMEELDLLPFLLHCKEKWKTAAEEKKITLELDVPTGVRLNTDGGFLDLVLGNLVENALKYGHSGGTITCRWNASASCLSITDDGPGITEAQLPKLFDRFYRGDESRNSRVQGTGLGLSIVKKLTDLLDIRLEVKSNEASGTSFLLFFSL